MKVPEIIQTSKKPVISVEIEPPLKGRPLKDITDVLDHLVDLGISYINLTNHVNGTRLDTIETAKLLMLRYKGVEIVPHIICSGCTAYDHQQQIEAIASLGIENIMALRGDPPKGPDKKHLPFEPRINGHSHANELITQVKGLESQLCIAAACYPEGHKESPSFEQDIYDAVRKVKAGADYLVTQMLFDNTFYFNFVRKLREAGVTVPVIPGLMPIYLPNHPTVLREVFGVSVQDDIKDGIEHCTEQVEGLLRAGVRHLHLFASRKSPVKAVIEGLVKFI